MYVFFKIFLFFWDGSLKVASQAALIKIIPFKHHNIYKQLLIKIKQIIIN